MKKRKVLAFVLSLALIITLIPASAFAGSSNSVDRVTTVAPDSDIPAVTLTLKATGDFTETTQTIKLSLTNGEWPMGKNEIRLTPQRILTDNVTALTTAAIGPSIAVGEGSKNAGGGNATATALSITQTTAEFEIETDDPLENDDVIYLTLMIHSGSTEGEVKVNVNALDSQFSPGTYTVAVVGEGNTTATVVSDPQSTWRTNSFEANAVEIRENAVNSIGTGAATLRLTLPSGMSWKSVGVKGNMGTQDTGASNTLNATASERDYYLVVNTVADDNIRQVMTIIPEIAIGKDAKLGDITLSIRKQGTNDFSNASGLVIGKYVEENVKVYTVKEDKLPEIIAGRLNNDGEDYTVEVTFEEEIASALVGGRYIDFEFPSYVQVTSGAPIKVKGSGTHGTTEYSDPGVSWTDSGFDIETGELHTDWSSFEFTLPSDLDKEEMDKFVFTIPVTVQGDTPAGDLKLKVSGSKAGVADTELVVGKILAPISVEIKLSDIRTGIQNQTLSDIIIKENFPGALMEVDKNVDESGLLLVTIDSDVKGTIKDYTVELVAGDLELDEDAIDTNYAKNGLEIPIDRQSIKTPGEIKISGLALSIDRTPAEGKYVVDIGGSALVDNEDHNKVGKEFGDVVVSEDYLNVITPADANVYGTAAFVIGAMEYEVEINGVLEKRSMDAAAYIDSANRTMVPIRFAANSLGVSDDFISWDSNSKTATVMKGDRIILIPVGKSYLMVNGVQIPMDTVAVNKDGRVFVPIAHLSKALGASYTWDQGTKTVTITNQK